MYLCKEVSQSQFRTLPPSGEKVGYLPTFLTSSLHPFNPCLPITSTNLTISTIFNFTLFYPIPSHVLLTLLTHVYFPVPIPIPVPISRHDPIQHPTSSNFIAIKATKGSRIKNPTPTKRDGIGPDGGNEKSRVGEAARHETRGKRESKLRL